MNSSLFVACQCAGAGILVASFAACGGGGGGSTVAAPAPSPSSSGYVEPISPGAANVSGTVVDYVTNTPKPGVTIATAAYVAGASPAPIATTDATGSFHIAMPPGTYLLVIGSNSPADTTTTLHTKITVTAGADLLAAPMATAPPNVTLTAAQTSGNFRLTTLSGNQLSCYTAANAGRVQLGLPQLIPDEYLTEAATALVQEEVAQNTDTPAPLFGSGVGSVFEFSANLGGFDAGQSTTSFGFAQCSTWTGVAYSYVAGNPPYSSATSSSSLWYGANQSALASEYAAQAWQGDPR
jgi:hypothetical protein